MRTVSLLTKFALAAAVAASAGIFLAGSTGSASAQFIGGGQGGGGHRGGGFEMHNPCAFGGCFRHRRPPRRYGPGPGVVIIEEDPYIYDESLEPPPRRAPPRAKSRPKAKKVEKPRPPPVNAITQGQTAGTDYRPDEILVEFPLSTPQSEVDAIARQNNIEQLGSQEIALLDVRLHRWRVADGQTPEGVAAELRNDNRVSDANLNSPRIAATTWVTLRVRTTPSASWSPG